MRNRTEAQLALREHAIHLALGEGYRYAPNTRDPEAMIAPLGRFESEPFYLPYFYADIMNGGGNEPMYDGETVAADIVEVSDDERAAFGLDDRTAFVALWYSGSGFVSLEQLTPDAHDELRESFDAEVRDE